jgi:hypothetical protein
MGPCRAEEAERREGTIRRVKTNGNRPRAAPLARGRDGLFPLTRDAGLARPWFILESSPPPLPSLAWTEENDDDVQLLP